MTLCEKCIHEEVCDIRNCQDEADEKAMTYCADFKNKADFVEVVRCSECANSFFNRRCDTFFCMLNMPNKAVSVKPNHFCGYGERKEDNG